MTKQHRVYRSPSEWQNLFDRFSDSGLTIRTFCDDNDLAYGTFSRRLRNYTSQTDTPLARPNGDDWLPLDVQPVPGGSQPVNIELILPGGVTLKMTSA